MSKSIKDVLCGISLKEVKGGFYCYNNKFTSLEGCPKEVGGEFDCSENDSLVSFEGCPKIAGSFRYINGQNSLLSQKYNGSEDDAKEAVSKLCKVKGPIWILF